MIYKYLEYREYIRDFIEKKKRLGDKITYESLANSLRIQKSYLSKVLSGRARLSSDQAYLLTKFLKLDNEGLEYFNLLIELDSTSLEVRKIEISKKIEAIQQKKNRPKEHLNSDKIFNEPDTSKYYFDPLHQLIHIALTIKEFQKEPEKILKRLNISKERFNTVLTNLEKMQIIAINEKKIDILVDNVHLDEDSNIYWPWKNQLGDLIKRRLQYENKKEDISFSATFSCDKNTFLTIRENFFKMLEETQISVSRSESKRMYQLNFDLFNWL